MIATSASDLVLKAINSIFNCCPTVINNDLLSHLEIKQVAQNNIFIHEGDRCNGIYIVAEGGIKLYLKNAKGDQIFLFKTVNDIIGIQPAMSGDCFHYSASAIEDSVLAFMPKMQVEKILTNYPTIFFSLIKKVNEKANAIESRSSLMMSDSAEKLVMKTLEDLESRFGTDGEGYIKIQIPVKDLAGYVCMSKTNLYRVLNNLEKKTYLTHHLDKYRLA